ncbi:MAG: hypothetical protein ABFC89_05600 [Methanospirillum sp.]
MFMRPQQRGGRAIALCGLLLLLISGVAAAVAGSPIVISNSAADGEPFQVPASPAHVWVAGDVFSLHGVDQYRYIVVYSRDTADGRVHGCYEVQQEASGRYVVSQYVHGQEVFDEAFLSQQGAKFLANVPLGEVVITDDTPADSGKTYFGLTLGSIYGGANAPSPTTSPEPIPTAPHWPSATALPVPRSTHAASPTTAPTGVVSVTLTPGPTPSSSNPKPYPMPTVTGTVALPTQTVTTAPTGASGDGAAIIAPVVEPANTEPTVTSAPSRVWGKRFAAWQAPSITGRRVSPAVSPAMTLSPGTKTIRMVRSFGRFYPSWSTFGRSTT